MPDSNIVLRPACSKDREAVRGLIGELGYQIDRGAPFERIFTSMLADPSHTLLVAESEGVVVGFAGWSRVPSLHLCGQTLLLDELAVAASARGKGVGKALLAALSAAAQELGAVRIKLTTNRARESYRRGFYLKNGYTETNSAVFRIDLVSEV